MQITIDKTLASAIIDMDNIGYSEGLGPESEDRSEKWSELVRTVSKEFDLQNSVIYEGA